MSSAPALATDGLTLTRGTRTLFSTLSFAVKSGEALTLRGANGSGKTSLLRVLAGLTAADAGRVSWRGRAVAPFDKTRAAEALYIGHANGVKDELTALENLTDTLAFDGLSLTPDALSAALTHVGLHAQANLPARRLSQGQKRRIGLAHLSLCQKSLWLLDEPTNALDREGIALFASLVDSHLARGGLACIATHVDLTLAASARVLDLSAGA